MLPLELDAASPLESEMTPCVAELVSPADGPNLITTHELLLYCPIASAFEMRLVYKVPDHPSCSNQNSTCCTGDFSHEVLDRVVIVRSVRRQISEHTKTAQPSVLLIIEWLVTITLSGIFHSRACYAFRSRKVWTCG